MGLLIKGYTDDVGNVVTNPSVFTHGTNFFNKDDDRLQLNKNITGNGFDDFNGRFSSAPIKVKPNTFYHGFFGGYNTAWMDKDLKRLGYDSGGAGNVAVAKKTPGNCEYVEFSGPMDQIETHMLIESETAPIEYIPYIQTQIRLKDVYSIGDNDYVDFDNSKIVLEDGTEIPVEVVGAISIYTNQYTYIYLDASREDVKVLGNIEYDIPLSE